MDSNATTFKGTQTICVLMATMMHLHQNNLLHLDIQNLPFQLTKRHVFSNYYCDGKVAEDLG